jgi:hypothetical protein
MKRFAQDGLGDRLAQKGRLTPELMRALADEIATFHEAAEPLSGLAAAGGGGGGLRAVIDGTCPSSAAPFASSASTIVP